MFVGFASVRPVPANVTVKLFDAEKSGVMVEPSVSVVIVPRCAAVNVWAVSVLAVSAS